MAAKMILVESDENLARYVARFFADRYDVRRVATLSEAASELDGGEASLLFVDIDFESPLSPSFMEDLRRNHPNMRIVITYLSPPSEWPRNALRKSADVLVRKPYSLPNVDEAIRAATRDAKDK